MVVVVDRKDEAGIAELRWADEVVDYFVETLRH